MRTFCLHPSKDSFTRVCTEPAAKRLGPAYDAWVAAAAFKFGYGGDDFVDIDADISTRAISEPSATLSVSVLYMFYATGELKYIDLVYQCIGNIALPLSSRVELAKEFKAAKSEYLEYLADKTNPPLVDSVKMAHVDFTHFDGIDGRAKDKKLERHPLAG